MTIPKTMNAYVLQGHGGFEMLEFHDNWPVPVPGDNDALIKVGACGLNNTDINTRVGWYSKSVIEATTGDGYDKVGEEDPSWGGTPITFPRIQGADPCGIVVAVGAKADQSLMGKRVISDNWLRDWSNPENKNTTGYFGSERDGGFAQYTTIDYRNVGAVQCDLSDAELATFSCSYTTAEGMLTRAFVDSGDTVLVTGASGGVGSALIQLAKRRGATVIALASENKHDALAAMGADVLLPRTPEDLKAALQERIGKTNVSVVADVVGGEGFSQVLDVLERGGRYTCSGAIGGPLVTMDLRTFYLRDLTLTGSTVIPPHIFTDLVGYIERGEIKPMLAASFPLAQLPKAQQVFVDKQHTGNIAVTVD